MRSRNIDFRLDKCKIVPHIEYLHIGIDFGQNNYHAMALFLLYPQGIEKQKAALSVLEDAAFTSNVKII